MLDEIINTVNEVAFQAVNAVETGLSNTDPEVLGFRRDLNSALSPEAVQEAKQTEIENGIVQLETLLNATIDKDFDKFEIYTLRNILSVGHEEEQLAEWVRLEHYKNLDISPSQVAPTPEQVQLERRKLHETIKLNNMLKAEEARNQAVLSKLHRTLRGKDPASPFAFLASLQPSSKNAQPQSFSQNVQYAVKQLPALRDMIESIKASLHTLPNARQSTEDSTSLKRMQYVETQSGRALQRRGVDVQDSTTAGAAVGRRIGRDEVEGIEAVANALDRTPDDEDMEE